MIALLKENLSLISIILRNGAAMMVSSTKISVQPENRKELLQTLQMLLGRIRQEKGCIKCNVYQDVENENAFIFIEEWETEADLDKHLGSDRFGVLLGAVKLLSETSEIKFTTLAQTTEIEALKKLTH